MAIVTYNTLANLEQSLYEKLVSTIASQSLQVLDDNGNPKDVRVRIGYKLDNDYTLPMIQVYHDSNPSNQRLTIGSNRRDTRYLVIIDIRSNNDTNRLNLTDFVIDTINDGFEFYEYTANGENPTKTQKGYVGFDFISNQHLSLGDDAPIYDQCRQRISISCWLPCK